MRGIGNGLRDCTEAERLRGGQRCRVDDALLVLRSSSSASRKLVCLLWPIGPVTEPS